MITVIGAGAIGLCTAYFLHKEGYEVQIIEKNGSNDTSGCSHGNAGMIVPSHFVPLAAPGVISQGLKWLLNSKSPFYIKPRLDADLLKWLWLFYRSSNLKNILRVGDHLFRLNDNSLNLYKSIISEERFDVGFERKGLMMLYQKASVEAEEHRLAEEAGSMGVKFEVLNQKEIQNLETDFEMNVRGGVHYFSDAHLNPGDFMIQLKEYLIKEGVKIHYNTSCENFISSGKNLTHVQTNNGTFKSRRIVIATGSWSQDLAKNLEANIPLQGGKGYSMTIENCPLQLKTPSILCERKIALTPMGNSLRVAGTMEIAGTNRKISRNRLQGIRDGVSRYLTNFEPTWTGNTTPWTGLRPVSPDGLPYIGKCDRWDNLYINTGHAMMGMSLAPVSGQLLTDMMLEREVAYDTEILSPDRFSRN